MTKEVENDNLRTREGLLKRLGTNGSDSDWQHFYELYSPLIHSFAVRSGCNASLTCDILQETMIVLTRKLPEFQYDKEKGSFRSWLLHIVFCRVADLHRRQHACRRREDEFWNLLPEQSSELEQKWDEEWHANRLRHSLRRLRQELSPGAYQIFTDLVLEKKTAEEVAANGMTTNAVYQQKYRAIRQFKQVATNIEKELKEGKAPALSEAV